MQEMGTFEEFKNIFKKFYKMDSLQDGYNNLSLININLTDISPLNRIKTI